MKIRLFVICFFVFVPLLKAQKVVQKTILSPNNQIVLVDTKDCYKVELQTSISKEILVEANIEGQYHKNIVVKVEEDGVNLLVGIEFLPSIAKQNDKLSAHKIIPSIGLKIFMPEHIDATVFGTNSTVVASGKFKNLKVILADGNCTVKNVSETVNVQTQKGDIHVFTNTGDIEAKSIYGAVKLLKLPKGDSVYKLASIEGNIYVNKTE